MKTIVNKFFIVITFLFGVFLSLAKNNPPPPNPNGRNNGTPSGIPPPPGLTIDENLPVLLIIALLFGIYIVYNQSLKKINTNL